MPPVRTFSNDFGGRGTHDVEPRSKSHFDRPHQTEFLVRDKSKSMADPGRGKTETFGRQRPRNNNFGPVVVDDREWDHLSDQDPYRNSEPESEAESLTGFPFEPLTLNVSDIETNGKEREPKISEVDPTILENSSDREVYNIDFSNYLDEEYASRELRAELMHEPRDVTASRKKPSLFIWV